SRPSHSLCNSGIRPRRYALGCPARGSVQTSVGWGFPFLTAFVRRRHVILGLQHIDLCRDTSRILNTRAPRRATLVRNPTRSEWPPGGKNPWSQKIAHFRL